MKSSLKVHSKATVQEICEKYENVKDKIALAEDNLSQIRSSVSDSTRKIINNQVQLEDL